MITIQKQSVINLLMVEYMADFHAVNDKLRFLERKYNQTWDVFSQAVESASEEDFEQWDDYIEWKAYVRAANNLAIKMDEVKHGNFEIA